MYNIVLEYVFCTLSIHTYIYTLLYICLKFSTYVYFFSILYTFLYEKYIEALRGAESFEDRPSNT